jgi:putative redox protein
MSVIAEIGTANYAVTIDAGSHTLLSDEPASRGGGAQGPTPYDLLLASLAACTAITLRMYAQRKGWDLKVLRVGVRMVQRANGVRDVERSIRFDRAVDASQQVRLLEIAEKTPVTLSLRNGMTIVTRVEESGDTPQESQG